MYRKPGALGVLKGVLSGPYTGKPRIVDATRLPRVARQRLADVLSGRADPTPILHESPSGLASRFRATWGVLLAIIALATLTGVGFADPRRAWAYQPSETVLGYAAFATLLTWSVLALYRRRALASGSALVPGRYLLPLDIVEVPAADRDGEQLIVVTPLGSARDARIREVGKRAELLLVLDGGAEVRFALRSEREGEHALARLEHAQSLLEELTYARHLEKALANDAFFDIRVDDSWESLSPTGPVSRATSRRRAFLHGWVATASAVALGGVLGWAALGGRNWASDRALYLRALRVGTLESLDAYLIRGTSHRLDAEVMRDRLVAQRAELAQRATESRSRAAMRGFDGPPRAEWELTPEEARLRSGLAETCEGLLRARAAPTHPEVTSIMEGFVRRGRTTGEALVPVRVDVREGSRPAAVPESSALAFASTMIVAFERIFSQVCPASLVKFAVVKGGAPTDSVLPGVDITIDITWPRAPTWTVDHVAVHAPRYVFDVALHPVEPGTKASFRLTMPAPEQPPTALRPRSLFTSPARGADGAEDTTVYPLLAARAFDRLYDELYALFFRGDPEVPLRGE